MNNITEVITEIKSHVSLQEWQNRILDCQNSGISVKEWCRINNISPSTYYARLRKIREDVIEENQIVPLPKPNLCVSEGIRIESSGITVTLPANVSSEQLTAILVTLRSC